MRPGSNTSLGLRKGAWTADEDTLLKNYIDKHGEGKWHLVPLKAGLKRCRKSCRLRWLNYLRPNIKRGNFGEDEIDLILRLHKLLGNRWSLIAGRIPGRTANDVKNYWNTHLRLRSKQQKREPKDDESLQVTRVTIIKPQPRSYSKPLNGCRGDYPDIVTHEDGKQRSLNEFAKNLNMSTGLISPSNILVDHENVNEYLDSFIDDYEDEIGGKLGWSFSSTDSANEKALNGVQQRDDQISLFDFPMDEVTWDFINSD